MSSEWSLDDVVEQLAARRGALDRTRSGHPAPSRDALRRIAHDLRAALFPAHWGPPHLAIDAFDGFVGRTLAAALTALEAEVVAALDLRRDRAGQARQIVRDLASSLPDVRTLLDSDLQAAFDGDPAAQSLDEPLLCYPGFTAILYHRIAHRLHALGVPLVPRILADIAHDETSIDIHPAAQIGPSFFIDHGTGVVIGETAQIGTRVRLYQGVTLGARSFPVDDAGRPHKGIARHPIIEDDVVIYAGATLLGRITIGKGSSIGGNVWLTRSVPPGSRVTQAQVRSDSFEAGGGI